MPWTNNPEIDSLRMTYNAAHSAHQGCARALIEARMQGAAPSHDLVEAESKARRRLADVRSALLAAMTKVIAGDGHLESPTPP
jgi:hypothetical protein